MIIHFMTKWKQVTEKIVCIILMILINTFDFSYINNVFYKLLLKKDISEFSYIYINLLSRIMFSKWKENKVGLLKKWKNAIELTTVRNS